LFVVLGVLTTGAVADTKDDLEQARRRLAEIEGEVAAQRARLDELRVEVARASERVFQAREAIAVTRDEIALTRDRLSRAEARLAELGARLDARVRDAYMNGPASGLEFILEAQSLADLTERVELVAAVTAGDAELAAEVESVRNDLEIDHANLQAVEARQVNEKEALEKEEAKLRANLDEQQAILDDLEAKTAELDQIVADLEDKLRREELARIRAARRAAKAAGSSGPHLVDGSGPLYACPVGSPYGYSASFGAPRSGGRVHQGVDMFAAAGTPIFAPFPGNAVDASNYPLGGLAVKVYGANGYVYNAHMSAIGQLGPVSTGDVIGYVGNTGNAIGTASHNHFEWHPGGGSAVDPYPYLVLVCP
jgi:peptidoglycan LD-endopeptidase LytH